MPNPTTTLDVVHARAQFPVFDSAQAEGWALMDNAGGSVAPRQVSDAVVHYLRERHVQLGASYPLSVESGRDVDAGRAAAATLVGADPDEIVLGASTTMNVYVLAQALRATWRPGDAVVVTDLDHEANGGAWRRLADTGIDVREWKMDPSAAELRPEDLDPHLADGRVRLVAFTHCSNVVGTVHDVGAITARCHAAGAQVCVDGVAFAPHRRVDVKALGVDWYLTSLYKVYGPHLGLLYGRRDRLLEAQSQNHFFYSETQIPHKLMPGNVSHELAASLVGTLDYLRAVHAASGGAPDLPVSRQLDQTFARFTAHEAEIVAPLIEYLHRRRDVRIVGRADADPDRRVPTVAFVVDGVHSRTIPEALDADRVAIRWGDFYAARAIDALDLRARGGVIRVSLVHYNTAAEVDRLIAALDRALPSA